MAHELRLITAPVHLCFIAVNIYPVLVPGSGLPFVGGAEVQQCVQMRALQRAGYRVSVLVKDDGQADVVDSGGIQVYKIPRDTHRGVRGLRFFYPRMSDVIKQLWRLEPDIVFVQAAGEQVAAAALYARLAGKRFVFAGASDPDFARGPLPGMPPQHTFMYRQGLRAAHAVIAQNMVQMQMLKAHFGIHGELIQNGYDEEGPQPGMPSGHVLWAATVKPLKRPDLFVELARRLPHLRFVMVGGAGMTPDAQAYLRGIHQSARRLPNLTVVGHVPYDQVAQWFDGAAVCVNTSDYEGFPNTFMQAWLRGTPTVSFVRPESAPGVTGTLACQGLQDMADHIQHLCTDASAWARASRACSEHFQTYHTLDRAVQRYQAVFANVLTS
jgi:glycosyltransferase involved in cell wall biosynthesis